ncbi:MAG: topoisomerase C-terminal repeat-containing protein, partial [Catenulispora sp.]
RDVEFTASGRIISFHGFLKAYVEGTDDPDAALDDSEQRLPAVGEGDALTTTRMTADGHSTKPPARFTEASLIKEMEEREIGRPSTYSAILGTILDRGYVFKKGTALVPSYTAFAVVGLLERHFGDLVNYEFTARMEDDLDRIARGEAQRVPWLRRFYFGLTEDERDASGDRGAVADHLGGLKDLVTDLGNIDAREVNTFPVGDGIMLRVGRFGPYIVRDLEDGTQQRANVPDDLPPDELTVAFAEELFQQPSGDRELGTDPATGYQIVAKGGRYGPYVTEILPEGTPTRGKNAVKPRTGSLFKTMTLDTVTLEEALQLLSLPRVVGSDPETGEEITVQNGRYGPYLKKGSDSRSITSEEQIFTITLDEALEIYKQPKPRGRAAAKPPLREIGPDPVSGKPVVIKSGFYGEYLTDGETNVTIPKSETVEGITPAKAFELMAEKRAKGPAAKKGAAKKTAAKKTTAKKTASSGTKTAAKKTAAKKTASSGAK